MNRLVIVGGGLAGSEAAWQAAENGFSVHLYEMRPAVSTPVHKTDHCAELVCSNSLGTNDPAKAPGLLKEELRRLGSLLIRLADEHAVPAGQALAVDRVKFGEAVTRALANHPNITLIREEALEIPPGPCIIATGPLTSPAMSRALQAYCGEYLYYYDAASPIVTAESLDCSKLYKANRYDHGGEAAYWNAPLDKAEYESLVEAIRAAERTPYAPHEDPKFFEACMPVEEKVDRGIDTLRFGAMKPVGLRDPRTGKTPHAVLQLRPENKEGTLYNLVGLQTRMKWGEQARVFRMIPGLEAAEFARYGVMHRNIFVNAPTQLLPTLQMKRRPDLFLAGQITGVEGYVEDIASGLLAGLNASRLLKGEAPFALPPATACGALMRFITSAEPEMFQPMNVTFGLFPQPEPPVKDKAARQKQIVDRALSELGGFIERLKGAAVLS